VKKKIAHPSNISRKRKGEVLCLNYQKREGVLKITLVNQRFLAGREFIL
jgi:hypothetical protein